MTSLAILQLIQAVNSYCSTTGPGTQTELSNYAGSPYAEKRSAACFKKIWTCGHLKKGDVDDNVESTERCISAHQDGTLK